MTSKQRFLNALLQKDIDRIPVAGVVTAINKAAMKYAGVTFFQALASPERYASLAASTYELYGLESIKVPFDMTVEAEILGAEIDFGDDFCLPQVHKGCLTNPDEFKMPDELTNKGRIPLLRKTLELLKKKYHNDIAVITSIVGPFSLANMVFGFERLLIWMATEPEIYRRCLEATTEFAIHYCEIQQDMGTDTILIGEAAASGDLISAKDYVKNILPYHRKLCSSVSAPTILHICGNISKHFEYIAQTNAAGISLDDGNDMTAARKYCKGKVALIGYVPAVEIMLNGTAEQVTTKCRECIDNGVDILNAGCSWPPDVPDENTRAFVDSVGNL